MAAIDINQLFSHQRIGSGKTAVWLAIYFPLGLIVALLRIFLALHIFIIGSILPWRFPLRSSILRVMYMTVGLIVIPPKLEYRDNSAKVIVANHVSVLDHVIIRLLFPSIVPNVWNLPPLLNWALGYSDMGAEHGRQKFLEKVSNHCRQNSMAVLAFPEGAMTNGKAGLLKFSSWAFSLNQDVQPFLVTTHRPFLDIKVEALGSSLWQDLLWFLFVPFTIFKVRVLPVERRTDFASSDEFSQGVQRMMATALRIEPTSYTSADKAEYVKRIHRDASSAGSTRAVPSPQTRSSQQRAAPSPRSQSSPAMDKMVKQVQDVLPHIPAHIIRRDLESTNSVDTTIFNILENKTAIPIPSDDIQVAPGGSTSIPSSSTSPNTSQGLSNHNAGMGSHDASLGDSPAPSPACTKFAADRFGRSSSERQQSLQERKAALLANARRRFAETTS